MHYSGAEITIKRLEELGVQIIAGIPGGANLPLYHCLHHSQIRHILARHEQGAGFIAQGVARSTGKAAVCFATSGPGATNVLTAVADAKIDSVPLVVITGQVATPLIGTDAFQEIDTYGLTLPICKHNYLVRDARDLLSIIPEAFRIAESGRPGPVVVDIPKDIQKQVIELSSWPKLEEGEKIEAEKGVDDIKDKDAAAIVDMISRSVKPLIFIGGGIIQAQAGEEVMELAEKNSIPVVSTLMGLGTLSSEHPLFMGMIGMHGSAGANKLLREADLILALGVRFDDRATGKVEEFCPEASIIHIDIDASEINKIKSSRYSIVGDVKAALTVINPKIMKNSRSAWMDRINHLKEERIIHRKENAAIDPKGFIRKVGERIGKETIITTDVGQHQMWVAQAYPFSYPRSFLTSGGMGTMGFGLPAAIGASLSHPDKKILCFSGDGSILMNIQELATLADIKGNITVIILNNGYLGMVRQQQEYFYDKVYMASSFPTHLDFAVIARGFGIKSYTIRSTAEMNEVLDEAFSHNGPSLIDVSIESFENVSPTVIPGKGNHEMILEG